MEAGISWELGYPPNKLIWTSMLYCTMASGMTGPSKLWACRTNAMIPVPSDAPLFMFLKSAITPSEASYSSTTMIINEWIDRNDKEEGETKVYIFFNFFTSQIDPIQFVSTLTLFGVIE
ncbi:hypothetical protein G210_2525, partial [Candida maltosa Xu316]